MSAKAVSKRAQKETLTWTHKPVDRSGIAKYLHLIRSPDDPKELPRGVLKRDPSGWRQAMHPGTLDQWKEDFKELTRDYKPRTFNHIMLSVSEGYWTADRAAGKAPDEALWELVQEGWLEHTLEKPILFRRRYVDKGRKAPKHG